MGGVRVLIGAYRDWARLIAERVMFGRWMSEYRVVDNQESLHGWSRAVPELGRGRPELVVLIGWSWMVPPEIYETIPTLCLHPSRLPLYRGGSPLQHQIIAGERESAVSIFRVESGTVDSGDIYGQCPISLDGSLADILERIVQVGAPMLRAIVDAFLRGEDPHHVAQYHLGITSQRPLLRRTPEESEITPEELATLTAAQLRNKIRALAHPDYPPAFIRGADGEPVYLWRAELEAPR